MIDFDKNVEELISNLPSYKNDKNSLAFHFPSFQDQHKLQKKAFFTSPEEIFGYLLLLFRLNIGLNQEQMGAVLIYNKPLSKSGYAKIERAENSINMQILFDLSFLTGINFSHIFTMYNELIHTIVNSNIDQVIFHQMCGHYGLGNQGGYSENKNNIDDVKLTYKAKIKSYNYLVGNKTIKLINSSIDNLMPVAFKEIIKSRANSIISSKKYKIE